MTLKAHEKRVALITGAASGLGASFADSLARRNYDLVLVDQNEELLNAAAEKIARVHGVQCHPLKQDLTRPEAVSNIWNGCADRKLEIDFLVNNAGFHLKEPFLQESWPALENNINILLTVVLQMTHRFVPGMIQRRWGRVINVASVSGFMPGGVRLATYNATKTFLIPFSESLHFELEGTGVHLTAVCPGFMRTNLFANCGLTEVSDTVPGFMWLEPREVAEKGIASVMRNRPLYIAGWFNRAVVLSAKFLPRWLVRERTRILHRSAHAKLALREQGTESERRRKLVALVTGASSGIGASFCKVLAKEGYNLILVARQEEPLQKFAAELTTLYAIETHVIAQDLTDPQSVEVICDKIRKIDWPVDLLVNNAGYPVSKVFFSMSWPEVEAVLQIYIKTVVRLTHKLIPGMITSGWGRVINVASLAAFEPGSYQSSLYSSSKAFQVAISESITAELEGTGVLVTAVCPGFTKTGWIAKSNLKISSVPGLLWMESDDVARIGFEAAIRGTSVCLVGTVGMRLISLLFRLAPRRLVGYILSRKRRSMTV